MFKRIVCMFLCVLFCVSVMTCCAGALENRASDGGSQPANKEVPLTEEEASILEAIGSDVNVISDVDYIEIVSELIYHPSSFSGTVYQLEGVLSLDGENISVCRTLVNDEQTLILGLPLRFLEKEIDDGAWICVTGIVTEVVEEDGSSVTVLDVIAIEVLPEYGQATLQWDGSSVHQH